MFERYGDHGEPLIEVHTSDGVAIAPDIGHGERMRRVVERGLEAIADGRIGVPDVMQAVRVLEVQDAVYEHARSTAVASGPFANGSPQRSDHPAADTRDRRGSGSAAEPASPARGASRP